GRSLAVLTDEVSTAYNALSTGTEPALAPLAVQYRDYAAWQQDRLGSGALEKARSYWLDQLGGGGLEPLELPTDRPRPADRSFRGALLDRTIDAEALAAFQQLCRDEKVTLFAGLSALLRVQLLRYTGQTDFVLGTSTFGRPAPELQDQIGCYINTLALRDTLEPQEGFRALLHRVQNTLLDAMQHGEYPFDQVVRELGATTEVNRNALFDVLVSMGQGWGSWGGELEGLTVRPTDPPLAHSKLDLSITFEESPDGLKASAAYATDLFDADRITRLLEHFEVLLRAATATPDLPLQHLPLLTDHEHHRVTVEF
ncbi:condensation domain-containing protein, partial [Kitasatospora nipponensis]|uniref:condensation domain-containing protein n=1 Tax=Kitasatospora nipponensis TaxID=258049 RepID=UPI0031D92E0A